jgi:hypothetical protein
MKASAPSAEQTWQLFDDQGSGTEGDRRDAFSYL